ncbi:MAG TPA: hypothetical protein VMH28_12870 [Candidatus Acidoferrales bacterium]|nr:hypothetical protein [Candidatus Acidoferrales bacterium]
MIRALPLLLLLAPFARAQDPLMEAVRSRYQVVTRDLLDAAQAMPLLTRETQ